jgi:hypothetical protein
MSIDDAYFQETGLAPDPYNGVTSYHRPGHGLARQLPSPAPVNYQTERRELDRAYVVGIRLVNAEDHGKRAVNALVNLHEYINSKNITHPAVLSAARGIEQVVGMAAAEMIYDYMHGRVR